MLSIHTACGASPAHHHYQFVMHSETKKTTLTKTKKVYLFGKKLMYNLGTLCWTKIVYIPLGFDDNKVLKEQLGILSYIQVCKIISLKFNLELNLIKGNEEKLKDLDSEGLESERGISASSDNSDSEDLS